MPLTFPSTIPLSWQSGRHHHQPNRLDRPTSRPRSRDPIERSPWLYVPVPRDPKALGFSTSSRSRTDSHAYTRPPSAIPRKIHRRTSLQQEMYHDGGRGRLLFATAPALPDIGALGLFADLSMITPAIPRTHASLPCATSTHGEYSLNGEILFPQECLS